jgi:hypothetical protein
MARRVDEATSFVFVELTEQEPGMYDKCHARRDKIDLVLERISHEMKESGSWLSSFETMKAPEFKLSRKNGCTQCFIFLCPLFSRRLNHRHITTGSVLLSDFTEEKCNKLNNSITY